jgi:hypothetical protein
MLALYRCGRQFEALTAYQSLRRVLDQELGIEPSVPLQQLHRAVLAQDPDLAWDLPPAQAVDSAPPAATGSVSEAVPTPPQAARQRRHVRRRWLLGGSALAVLATAGAVSAVVIGHSPGSSPPPPAANSVGVINADGGLRDVIPVGQSPDGLALGAPEERPAAR